MAIVVTVERTPSSRLIFHVTTCLSVSSESASTFALRSGYVFFLALQEFGMVHFLFLRVFVREFRRKAECSSYCGTLKILSDLGFKFFWGYDLYVWSHVA